MKQPVHKYMWIISFVNRAERKPEKIGKLIITNRKINTLIITNYVNESWQKIKDLNYEWEFLLEFRVNHLLEFDIPAIDACKM